MKEKLDNSKFNIIAIFIFETIGCAISFSADYSGAGMAAILIKWIPAFIGLLTIIIYVISKLITKKYNWIITIFGIILIVTSAISIYLTDYNQAV